MPKKNTAVKVALESNCSSALIVRARNDAESESKRWSM